MSKKLPSPCVDVCKYKLKGHCIACSMTKAQKKLFKSLKSEANQAAFIEMLVAQQRYIGTASSWSDMYVRRCKKKSVDPPKIVQKSDA